MQVCESIPSSERGMLFSGSRKANVFVEINLDELRDVKAQYHKSSSADMSVDSIDVTELTEKLAASVQVEVEVVG